MRIAVLLSTRPGLQRRQMSPGDQAALSLALTLGTPIGLHVGKAGDPAVADYLGFGLPEITCIAGDPDGDVLHPLVGELHLVGADLVLAGTGAASRRSMLPYRLAAALRLPIVADVRGIAPDDDGFLFERCLGHSHTERVSARRPAMATVSGPGRRASWSFGRKRSGRIRTVEPHLGQGVRSAPPSPDRRPIRWIAQPQGSAAERIDFIRGVAAQTGTVLTGLEPEAAAAAVLAYLRSHGIIEEPDHD